MELLIIILAIDAVEKRGIVIGLITIAIIIFSLIFHSEQSKRLLRRYPPGAGHTLHHIHHGKQALSRKQLKELVGQENTWGRDVFIRVIKCTQPEDKSTWNYEIEWYPLHQGVRSWT